MRLQGRRAHTMTDERFWVATSLKHLYDSPTRVGDLSRLLSNAYGRTPPVEGLKTWQECLSGDLHLFFEACLPLAESYTAWLRDNLESRQLIPYVLDAADRKSHGALGIDKLRGDRIRAPRGLSLDKPVLFRPRGLESFTYWWPHEIKCGRIPLSRSGGFCHEVSCLGGHDD